MARGAERARVNRTPLMGRTRMEVDESQSEIRVRLRNAGAGKIRIIEDYTAEGGIVGFSFVLNDYDVRMELPLGALREFGSQAQWEQEERRLWQVLAIALRMRLDLVEQCDRTFEEEFGPDIVDASGQRAAVALGQWFRDNRASAKALPAEAGKRMT